MLLASDLPNLLELESYLPKTNLYRYVYRDLVFPN